MTQQTTRSALEQALDALGTCRIMAKDADGNYTREVTPKIITAALAAGRAALSQPAQDVDWLANVIRTVDGNNSLGAGALAEKIIEAIAAPQPPQEKKES